MTLGLIVGNRGFFPDHLARSGREDMLGVLANNGVDVVAPAKQTPLPKTTIKQSTGPSKPAGKRSAAQISSAAIAIASMAWSSPSLAAGTYNSIEEAQDALCPKHRVFEPEAPARAVYEELFPLYRDVYFGFGRKNAAAAPFGEVLPKLRLIAAKARTIQ